jgi:hypothetical protein
MATTLANLRTRIRQRIDKENSTYIASAEVLSYINASYAELYDLLVASYEDYFITGPTSFTLTTSDSGVYSLPSDFYKLKGLDYNQSGQQVAVQPFDWARRNHFDNNRPQSLFQERRYRIVGSNLRIEPSDNATGDYQLWYVPSYTALVNETDNVDSIITRNNWEEYIVLDVGIKILHKEESDASALIYEKQQMIERLKNLATERDVDQPEYVQDARVGDWFGYSGI